MPACAKLLDDKKRSSKQPEKLELASGMVPSWTALLMVYTVNLKRDRIQSQLKWE